MKVNIVSTIAFFFLIGISTSIYSLPMDPPHHHLGSQNHNIFESAHSGLYPENWQEFDQAHHGQSEEQSMFPHWDYPQLYDDNLQHDEYAHLHESDSQKGVNKPSSQFNPQYGNQEGNFPSNSSEPFSSSSSRMGDGSIISNQQNLYNQHTPLEHQYSFGSHYEPGSSSNSAQSEHFAPPLSAQHDNAPETP